MASDYKPLFKKCRLRLIQPEAGNNVPDSSDNDKWLVVELTDNRIKDPNYTVQNFYEWLGEGFTSWGTYSVKGNYTRNDMDGDFYIGSGRPRDVNKIWRYNPGLLRIYFSTFSGGWTEYRNPNGTKTTTKITDDLILYNTVMLRDITPTGNQEYSTGEVKMRSWIKPFREGKIFWMPNDIVLSR